MTYKVLVVDDHMLMRNLTTQFLQHMDIEDIDQASNGQEALDIIHNTMNITGPYDIILIDWSMPVMNGIDLLQECRKIERLNQTALIMLTAESEKTSVMQALNAGATSYIVKPISLEGLKKALTKVMKWLDQQKETENGNFYVETTS